MENFYNFGERLLKLREKSGLTQNQLAARLGLKNSTISKYESSVVPPPALMVRKIAMEFGVSSDYLLGLESSAAVSLVGLTKEQAAIITDLSELFKTQNNGLRKSAVSAQYEMLGRVTANLLKK